MNQELGRNYTTLEHNMMFNYPIVSANEDGNI